jgi:hypothetical protein
MINSEMVKEGEAPGRDGGLFESDTLCVSGLTYNVNVKRR